MGWRGVVARLQALLLVVGVFLLFAWMTELRFAIAAAAVVTVIVMLAIWFGFYVQLMHDWWHR